MTSHALLNELPQRLHHSARIIRDQEENRRLIEDVLGIPLVATWIENVPDYQDPTRKVLLCHTFYELGDGSALAFFQFDKKEHWERVVPVWKERTGQYDHAALKVTRATLNELTERLEKAGHPYRVLDHGYCLSLYVSSDQGYTLEFTSDAADAVEISKRQRMSAHASLSRWTRGERASNNDLRHEDYVS